MRGSIPRGVAPPNALKPCEQGQAQTRAASRPDGGIKPHERFEPIGGGRGPVAPPVFKTGLAAIAAAGGFDSLPPPPAKYLILLRNLDFQNSCVPNSPLQCRKGGGWG